MIRLHEMLFQHQCAAMLLLMLAGLNSQLSALLAEFSHHSLISRQRRTMMGGKGRTAKASGLTPFSMRETQMDRLFRSRPVFFGGVSLVFFLGRPLDWERGSTDTSMVEISFSTSRTSLAACCLLVVRGSGMSGEGGPEVQATRRWRTR